MSSPSSSSSVEYKHEDLTLFATGDPDFISFQYGAPGRTLLPTALLKTAALRALSEDGAETLLQYGPSLGSARFLDRLAEFLSRPSNYDGPVAAKNLAVTSGASASFSNILTLFAAPNTQVIVENPTYFVAIRVLEDHAFSRTTTIKVPVDADGIIIEDLEAKLQSLPAPVMPAPIFGEKRFPYLLFLVPTYSNPTGTCLSHERRRRLIDLARKHDVLVVCDDVYQLLHYNQENGPPKRLVAYDLEDGDGYGNVISNQSFSKILAPGSRCGWIEAGSGIISQLSKSGLMYSGGSPSHAMSEIIGQMLIDGSLEKHVDLLRSVYRSRMDLMCETVVRLMPYAKFIKPSGGVFLWIELPGTDTALFLEECMQHKVAFGPGNIFSSDGSHSSFLRLTVAFYEDSDIVKGIERLSIAFAGVKNGK